MTGTPGICQHQNSNLSLLMSCARQCNISMHRTRSIHNSIKGSGPCSATSQQLKITIVVVGCWTTTAKRIKVCLLFGRGGGGGSWQVQGWIQRIGAMLSILQKGSHNRETLRASGLKQIPNGTWHLALVQCIPLHKARHLWQGVHNLQP